MFPIDAKLTDRARVRLVKLAKSHRIDLQQSYVPVVKLALTMHQRYARAKQFGRANAKLRKLRTYLGRRMREIERSIEARPALNAVVRREPFNATRVMEHKHGRPKKSDPSPKYALIYALHAPEVERIGNGKAHKPYEFGVKVSIATTVQPSRGGQFVLAAKALRGNPNDGHTLATLIPYQQSLIGNEIKRIIAERGYCGHGLPAPHDLRVYVSEQKRGVTRSIKREVKRRAAVEPVIGHMKTDHRMGGKFLAHTTGDAINAVMAALGCNFRRLLAWLALWLTGFCTRSARTKFMPWREDGLLHCRQIELGEIVIRAGACEVSISGFLSRC